MAAYVEVWPLSADESSIWLLGEDAPWRSAGPVLANSTPKATARSEVISRGKAVPALLCCPSSRQEEQGVILDYLAVIIADGPVPDQWPSARAITPRMSQEAGTASVGTHELRGIEVLMNGLQHFWGLLERPGWVNLSAGEYPGVTPEEAAEALVPPWPEYLSGFEPVFNEMFRS